MVFRCLAAVAFVGIDLPPTLAGGNDSVSRPSPVSVRDPRRSDVTPRRSQRTAKARRPVQIAEPAPRRRLSRAPARLERRDPPQRRPSIAAPRAEPATAVPTLVPTQPPAPSRTAELLPIDDLKRLFRRPDVVAPGAAAREEAALGARLFAEPRLSTDHKLACASCHDPERAFGDGRARGRGLGGQPLARNVPALWNIGTQKRFYWDGRVESLEAQARDAIERESEMDGTLEAAARWLAADQSYVASFQRVYGTGLLERPDNITRAIAAYERTLVSPQTRFDRWIDGVADALQPNEIAGFRLFAGKARCLACHGGWRFTDDAFHDVGLPSRDRGRSALPGASTAGRAFKTPSLREAVWTAPYMHDGSLATLDDVLDHYISRIDRRSSIAPELRAPLSLTADERRDLVAFLRTLSSERSPRAP